jgi:hypothetical protein
LQCELQHVPKHGELVSACLCFDEFPEGCFELAGDLQNAEYLFKAGFQFREEFLLLQLKCDLLLDSQDRAYSFRKARNREDAAERLQKFVHWEVSFEATFHRRFAVLARIVHGLCPR